ncbi:NAD-dependent epimerase/dehydratase family protein [Flavobacterium sp. RSP29]|uniref:NAD-dependent epimerase/dehydratase family protein n=1 Tax=Flavobacterium sp. RSP29 TaxID=3401731 RepID=UPI003AAAB53B
MEIVVTGANGFLGKVIVKELESNYTLFSLSRTFGDYQVSLENEIPNFTQKFNLVIHAAGKAHSIPRTLTDKNQFYDINVLGTQNLLKGLDKVGAPEQFVFISSVSVYGQESGSNINEEHPLEAKDPYGLSKIGAEVLVTEWCNKNNVVCTILRLPLLVGKNPPGNLGAMIKAIDRRYYFNIGGGEARKSMVVAEDVAAFITKVASFGGTYNLTDGVHPNFSELSIAISKQKKKKTPLNVPLSLTMLMGYAGDILGNKAPINSSKIKKITSDLTFNDAKVRELLGWDPQSVLEYLKNNSL